MKRERALQVVLVLVGLFYCFWGYILFDDLWHLRWLNGHSDAMPMFLSLNTALGVCLLIAVNQPAKHRLMIAYGAWSSLAHGFTMTIMSAQAVAHGMHRKDSPQDIVIFVAIGVALLALLPAKHASPASAHRVVAGRTFQRRAEGGTLMRSKFGKIATRHTWRVARMAIVNINPTPDSFPVIDIDQTSLTYEQISLLARGIKAFIPIKLV